MLDRIKAGFACISLAMCTGSCSSSAADNPGGKGEADAGDDGAATLDAANLAVQAPQLPECLQNDAPPGCAAAPAMTDWTCPTHWTSELVGQGKPWAYSICVPPEVPSCPDGQVAWQGETQCHPIGTQCPTGDFLDEPAIHALASGYAGSLLYVKPGATGTGSIAAPFGRISAALAAAKDGDVIVLSMGTHDEAGSPMPEVAVNKAIAIVGSCASGTIVKAPTPADAGATISVTAPGGVLLANVRVTGDRKGIAVSGTQSPVRLASVEVAAARVSGVDVSKGAGVELKDVVIRGTLGTLAAPINTAGHGLDVASGAIVVINRGLLRANRHIAIAVFDTGSSLELNDAVVRDTESQESDHLMGRGLNVEWGAKASVHRSIFDNNREAAVVGSTGGTTVELTDVAVRDTQAQVSGNAFGYGLLAQYAATFKVSRCLVERSHWNGITVFDKGTTVELTDLVVRDTLGTEGADEFGIGLNLQPGPAVTVNRALFEGNRASGVACMGTGAKLEATDVVVHGTLSQQSDHTMGNGLDVQDGAQAQVTRGWIESNRDVGIIVFDKGSRLDLTDVTVRDTQSEETSKKVGRGLEVTTGATVTVTRGLVEQNRDVGIIAGGEGTTIELTEVLVRNMLSRELDLKGGDALNVQAGALGTVTRSVFHNNRYQGVMAAGAGTVLNLTDLAIRDTASTERDGSGGGGIKAQGGARIVATRVALERNRETGIAALQAGTTIELHDVSILDTKFSECGEIPAGQPRSCVFDGVIVGGGTGLASVLGADVRTTRFVIGKSVQCGMMVARDGHLLAAEGEVHHNAIGLNVQVPDYDLSTVVGPTIRYYENGTNLDTTELPIPTVPDVDGGT
jgi:hypothetical protein